MNSIHHAKSTAAIFQNHYKPLLYLSTFFQSKLRLTTTGGAAGVASDDRAVAAKQGEVNAQHRPSAESENGGSKLMLPGIENKQRKLEQIICITNLRYY